MSEHLEDEELLGVRALVTGGGRGLGYAMATSLARAGAKVLAVDLDEGPLADLAEHVGNRIFPHVADVSVEEDVEGILAYARAALGGFDVLVNNAGIAMSAIRQPGEDLYFYDVDPMTVRRFFEVHVMGPFLLTKAMIPELLAQGSGRIITITTSLWHMGVGQGSPYGPMKAASEALTSAMANDLKGSGVTANVLIPGGPADTRFVPDLPNRSRADLIDPMVMGPPAVFLASPSSAGVNARRIIAKDWDPAVPPEEALAASSTPIGWPGEYR